MTTFPDRVRLAMRFDANALARDAAALADWEAHFNQSTYEGDWSGVALRTNGGRASLVVDPLAARPFADTPALARCPAVRAALEQFRCDLHGVRFLRLGVGARILEHRDYGLGLDESGEARLHIAVATEPGVEFLLGEKPVVMEAGECWYLDVNRHHEVYNGGRRPRIHLVVDAVANDWLRDRLHEAVGAGRGA